jgi:gliding motility-associated-like protein
MNYLKVYLFLLMTFFVTGYTQAQLASVQNGCAPLTVNFSVANNPASFFWDFGNGQTSTNAGPQVTYSNPGTYVIQFRLVPGGTILATDTVRVYEKPSITFLANDPTGCIPLDVTFTALVTADPGIVIDGYDWAFGDGDGAMVTDTFVTHTYNVPGSFTVGVDLETSFENCQVNAREVDFIQTSPQPNTRFQTDPNPAISCEAPFTLNLNNLTTGSGNLTFEWNFDNGLTSNDEQPGSITYVNEGTYTITLTTTNELGCSSTSTSQVSVGPPIADFTVPDTVCAGEEIQFVNNSSVGVYFWNFGTGADPELSTDANPRVTFNDEGPRSIQLSVTDPTNTCQADTTKIIYVDEVDATFTVDPVYSCNLPQEFIFTPLSNELDSFEWSFPRDFRSNDPIGVYTAPRDISIYGINGRNVDLNASLTAYNERGCEATFDLNFRICQPNALFQTDTTMGCAPLDVVFSDSSTACETIVNWTYVWGDGTTETFNNEGPHDHTYSQPGEYDAFLIIENAAGCVDTSYAITIEVGEPINPTFSLDQTTICAGDTLRVSDLTNDPRIDAWHYTANGARLEQCPEEPSTNLVFVNATGTIEVELEVLYNGCSATNTQIRTIDVQGPIARANYEIDCANPFAVSFIDSSLEASTVKWYFGDGDSSVINNPVHTYDTTGDYQVILVASEPGTVCPDSRDTFMVHVRDIVAEFEFENDEECSGNPLNLDASMSQDVNAECWKGYTWFFSDQRPITTQDSIIEKGFGPEGQNWATLVVEDINGCRDTISDTLTIFRVEAFFEMSDDTICAGQMPPISFTDMSESLESGDIVEWEWNFGDGGTSTEQNPTYGFPNPPFSGVLTITLTATNDRNCPGEFTRELIFYEPFTEITVTDTDLCVGDEISFSAPDYNDFGSFLLYDWTLDGNQISTANSGSQQFNQSGSFDLLLTYTEDSTGCVGTDRITIEVQDYPDASFFASANDIRFDSINCAGQIVTFQTNSNTGGINNVWQIDNGPSSQPNSGIYDFSFDAGTFTITNFASTTFGCRDTFSDTYTFVGPEGTLTSDIGRICAGEDITFSISDTMNLTSYTIQSGFNNEFQNNTSPATFNYPFGGTYRPLLEMTFVGQGLTCRLVDTLSVVVKQPSAVFDTDRDSYCSIDDVVFFLTNVQDADLFSYFFGDGSSILNTDQTTVDNMYSAPGVYNASVILEDTELGCIDTLTIPVDVTGDLGTIVSISDSIVCAGDFIVLTVDSPNTDYNYFWTPSSIDTFGSNYRWIYDPIQSSTITLTVTSDNCTEKLSFDIEVSPSLNIEPDSISILVDTMGMDIPVPGLPDGVSGLNIEWRPTTNLDVTDPLNPILTSPYSDSMLLRAIVYDENACDTVEFVRLLRTYRIPNVFYPGSMVEENQTFNVQAPGGVDGSEVTRIRIFNRWGQLVYDHEDPIRGWDGTKDGESQPSDVYMYIVEIALPEGETAVISGDVTLLR